MKICNLLFGFFAILSTSCAASESYDESIENIFDRVELTRTIVLRPEVDQLNSRQIETLKRAKTFLGEFLSKLNDSSEEVFSYLSNDLSNKYADLSELYTGEFEGESILSFEIFDYAFLIDGEEVILYFFLTSTLEGVDCTLQKAIALEKTDDNFRITRLSSEIRFKEFELRTK